MRPVHFEVHSSDPSRAAEFLRTVFSWRVERWGDQPYWMVSTGEGPGIDGGLMPRLAPAPDSSEPNSWVITVEVADLSATLGRVASAGGRVRVPTEAVPGVGWLAYAEDPDGNRFGLLQPDESAG